MRPELLENHQFVKYYQRWQSDSDSVVFVPVSDYFLKYDMLDEALKVCSDGLEKHPNLISGRLLLARIYMKRKQWEEAKDELYNVLMLVSDQSQAKELLVQIEESIVEESDKSQLSKTSPWCTLTMARLYSKQGNKEEATKIYRTLIELDPTNSEVREELAELERQPE